MWRFILPTVLCVCIARVVGAQPPSGQEQGIPPLTPQRHYNGIVAGEEAYLANDARRQAELGRQVNLNADMYWRWSGASSWYPGVFEAWPAVPGEVVGWPAASSISPPRVSPTSVRYSPLAPWAAAQGPMVAPWPAVRRGAPGPVAVEPGAAAAKPAQRPAAVDTNGSPENPAAGRLPGFVPQAEVAVGSDKSGAAKGTNPGQDSAPADKPLPAPSGGPRAF